jgi:hypothetical protein
MLRHLCARPTRTVCANRGASFERRHSRHRRAPFRNRKVTDAPHFQNTKEERGHDNPSPSPHDTARTRRASCFLSTRLRYTFWLNQPGHNGSRQVNRSPLCICKSAVVARCRTDPKPTQPRHSGTLRLRRDVCHMVRGAILGAVIGVIVWIAAVRRRPRDMTDRWGTASTYTARSGGYGCAFVSLVPACAGFGAVVDATLF